jgi:uncharacterized protein
MIDTPRSWEDYKRTALSPTATANDLAMFRWAREGNVSEVARVIHQIKNIEMRNPKGHTLLMLAAYNDHYDLAKLLIENGADVNTADDVGSSALMGVSFKGYNDLVHLLIQNGANPAHKNLAGQDAMQFAIMFGRTDTAKILSDYLEHRDEQKLNLRARSVQWFKFLFQQLRRIHVKR